MKKFFLVILMFTVLISCKTDSDSGTSVDNQKVKDLENEIAQLKLDKDLKDSVINESLSFFNEIKSNLEAIGLKKDEIRLRSEDPEFDSNDKQWILEQIRYINFLREENIKKTQSLNAQMKKSGVKIKELEVMIEGLTNDIKFRDEQIASLQGEMENLDREYAKLFDAYQVVAVKMDNLENQLNTVYYTYGSAKELVSNKVIEQRNGFFGIGKNTQLVDDFNVKYFARIDLTKDKEIFVEGAKIRLITDHPSSSYRIEPDGKNSKIVIMNPYQFWKVSKYLVVMVD